jgi:predicted phosphodiesterase
MKKGLAVADLHIGNFVSLMPPRVIINTDAGATVILQNPIQREIYSKWKEARADGPYDFIIIAGDICEGLNRKQKGIGNWTNDIAVQIQTAVDLIKMIPMKPGCEKKIFIVQGSSYHTDDNLTSDGMCAKLLGAKFNDELAIMIENEDYRIHVCHHVGGSSNMMYRSTPLAREMLAAAVHSEKYGKDFNLLLRAHMHYIWEIGSRSHKGFILPCFKGRDSYVAKQSLAWVPDIGYLVIKVSHGEASFYANTITLKGKNLIQEVMA